MSIVTQAVGTQVWNEVIKGNVAAEPTLLSSGMCFLRVARELEDEEGNPLPIVFVSIKFWGEEARDVVAALGKGDRVHIGVRASKDTSEDTRQAEKIAKYARQENEYRGYGVEIQYKKRAA